MKNTFRQTFKSALLGCFLLAAGAFAQEAPSADELLRAMRDMTVSQGNKDVSGTIRKNRTKIPFSLSARGETIVFQYKESDAWKRFDVRIREKSAQLIQVEGGKATVMAPASYTKTIAGTDVCYEDLSLRFLYWKGGELEDVGEAARIGIAEDRAATYIADAEGSATMFEGVADACAGMRALGAGMRLGGSWKKGIERDTARRG